MYELSKPVTHRPAPRRPALLLLEVGLRCLCGPNDPICSPHSLALPSIQKVAQLLNAVPGSALKRQRLPGRMCGQSTAEMLSSRVWDFLDSALDKQSNQ